jgi:hypothetical protein
MTPSGCPISALSSLTIRSALRATRKVIGAPNRPYEVATAVMPRKTPSIGDAVIAVSGRLPYLRRSAR